MHVPKDNLNHLKKQITVFCQSTVAYYLLRTVMARPNFHVSFPEEQLDSPVRYFVGQRGQTLQNGRWSIIRKLGWGPRSSTWLAVDSRDPDNIEAIKVFTVTATEDSSALNELSILQELLKGNLNAFPVIQDHFYEHSTKGRHLCLVLHVLGPSVESLRLSNTGVYLPVHIVKKVVADILDPLSELHGKKIIHGGECHILY